MCVCVSRFPRHRKLISINKIHTGSANKEFNLRHDWNSLLSDKSSLLFKRLSSEFYPPADTYPLYLSIFQKELGLKVQYGVDIRNVRAVQMAMGVQYLLTDQQASELQCRYQCDPHPPLPLLSLFFSIYPWGSKCCLSIVKGEQETLPFDLDTHLWHPPPTPTPRLTGLYYCSPSSAPFL